MADAPSRPLDAADDDEDEELPHCTCGTNRESKYAYVRQEYGFLGTLYLLWGGTGVPTKVSFHCVKCGETFDESTSPSVCKKYIK
jgi:hypothetical protein